MTSNCKITSEGETMTGTTAELCECLGVEYPVGQGLVKFLKVKGVAKETGTRPPKAGKGKPSTIYTIPKNIALAFTDEPKPV